MRQFGSIRLLVEEVGTKYRVLVTRSTDELHPEEIVYAGSAPNAADALAMAESAGEHAYIQIAA